MSWPTPQYTKGEINRAGAILARGDNDDPELVWAHDVLGNWRACHGYPINTFQATLRDKLRRMGDDCLLAQRLKRTPSIISKLQRFDKMNLARMQDIGGLRAIVSSVAKVRAMQKEYVSTNFKHELVSQKDYIERPKEDGYRSVHLVFRYNNPKAEAYKGLSIELQIRTRLQHAWATAVETMGTYLGQALKSRQGEEDWLKFFELAGSCFAFLENTPRVPSYTELSQMETFRRLVEAERNLGVLDKLRGFTTATYTITSRLKGAYHLVILDSRSRNVTVKPYVMRDLDIANKDYAAAEARANAGEPIEAVLVSAGPVALLRKAYPNYFLDTHEFLIKVSSIINRAATQS